MFRCLEVFAGWLQLHNLGNLQYVVAQPKTQLYLKEFSKYSVNNQSVQITCN